MIKYKLFMGDDLADAALMAHRAKLYSPGWMMASEYLYIADRHIQRHADTKLVIAFDGTTPVGALICTRYKKLMAFVRKSYRRRGIGSGMVRTADIRPVDCSAGEGIMGSDEFWKQAGLDPLSISYRPRD